MELPRPLYKDACGLGLIYKALNWRVLPRHCGGGLGDERSLPCPARAFPFSSSSIGWWPRLKPAPTDHQAPPAQENRRRFPNLLDHGLLRDGQVDPATTPTHSPPRRAHRLRAKAGSARKSAPNSFRKHHVRPHPLCGDGILLRQLIQDPQLRSVSAILFDEFHERHLCGDVSWLGAQLQATSHPDLNSPSCPTLMRASQKYLEPCAVLSPSGRAFPVGIESAETGRRRRLSHLGSRGGQLAASRRAPKATCSSSCPENMRSAERFLPFGCG